MSITDLEITTVIVSVKDILNSITAIATLVIAISTVVTIFLTRALVRENTLLRKAETEPEVVAYLAIHPLHHPFLNFILANVGRGPARNVSFRFAANAQDLEARNVVLRNSADRKPISFLPQGESVCVYFGNSVDVIREPRLPPFDVIIDYEDMKGRQHHKICLLDVAQFVGFSRLGAPPEKEIADALKKIEGHLKGVVKTIDDMGDIPKLLESHVWKKPEAPLEAFTELSEEAKAILKAAVAGGGIIMHLRPFGGEKIQAGRESLIPDEEPRTIASWVGGLEDLRRRRYIKDRGHKGEMFEVTREGYEAADELPDV